MKTILLASPVDSFVPWVHPGERWVASDLPHENTSCYGPLQVLPEVRSATYFNDKVKQTSRAPAFKLVTSKVFKSKNKLNVPYAESIPSLRAFLEEQAHTNRFFFIALWALPGPPFYTVIHLLEKVIPEGEDEEFDRVWCRYLQGDGKYRDTRLKFIPRVIQAPSLVMGAIKTLGDMRPVILGKRLEQSHASGSNYVEVSTDVGSSWVANKLKNLIIKEFADIVVEYSWVLESKKADELPERLIGGVCISRAVLKDLAQALKS